MQTGDGTAIRTSPGETPPDFTVFVDFDATLIQENFLVQWVRFSILKSRRPLLGKLIFLFKSSLRGTASIAASRFQRGSEWAVRLAYGTFEGVHEEEIGKFVNFLNNNRYFINLNRNTLNIVTVVCATVRRTMGSSPKIVIYSQGSAENVIRAFLGRPDVRMELERLGITNDPPRSISIRANRLEVADGVLTGDLQGDPVTKHKRIKELFENLTHFVFIGDDDDEALIHSMGISDRRFMNHRKLDVRRVEGIMADLFPLVPNRDVGVSTLDKR